MIQRDTGYDPGYYCKYHHTHNTTVDKIHKTHISKRKKVQKPKQEGGWGMLYSCTAVHMSIGIIVIRKEKKKERKLPGCSDRKSVV